MTTRLIRVLIIGSGPIIVGQAAEFDYAGGHTYSVKPLPEYRMKGES